MGSFASIFVGGGGFFVHKERRRSDLEKLNVKELVGLWHRAVGCVVRSVWRIRLDGRYKLSCALDRKLPVIPLHTK